MTSPPFMKLYVADYLLDTLELGALAHGAYLLLLMALWRAGGSIPADEKRLAKIAKTTPEEWAAIRHQVLPFFRRRGAILSHKRVSLELEQFRATSEARAKAGSAGGRKKASKSKVEDPSKSQAKSGNEVANRTDNREDQKEPPHVPQGDEVANDNLIPDPFDEFWREYPKKVGKGAAAKSYGKAVKAGHYPQDILAGLRRQVWPSEARFIPNPTTWLNQGRWMDEPPTPKPVNWI